MWWMGKGHNIWLPVIKLRFSTNFREWNSWFDRNVDVVVSVGISKPTVSRYRMSSVRCHFHFVVMVKERLGVWVRPVWELPASPLSIWFFSCIGVSLWNFFGRGRWVGKDVTVTTHWQEAWLSVSVNNLALMSVRSTSELLGGSWWVCVPAGSQLAWFAVRKMLVENCTFLT